MQLATGIIIVLLGVACAYLWKELDGWRIVATSYHSALIKADLRRTIENNRLALVKSERDNFVKKFATLQVWVVQWNLNHPENKYVDLEQLVRTCYVINQDGDMVRFAENG